MEVENRWYQEGAIDSVFNYYASGNTGNVVIALPTGTGKSVVIGGLQMRGLQWWPTQRYLNITHVKELVEQNANRLRAMFPTAPIGINCAGLNQRETMLPIIFASVGSISRNPEMMGFRDVVFIDECHLTSSNDDTMYAKIIAALKEINPNLVVVGFTATPYRLKQGMITDGGIFTDIVYNMTDMEGFNRLLAEGYLAPLIPRKTDAHIDTSTVGIVAGDFSQKQLQNVTDIEALTQSACQEMLRQGQDRKSWLVFAAGIKHAENVTETLQGLGVSATVVHSKISDTERNERLEGFKMGRYQAIVNNDVLTTGFDHPPIDMIGMLRATTSPGLWVQMLGRGTRPWKGGELQVGDNTAHWPEKKDCLVLDFARNTERLGPINDPCVPKKRKGAPGDAPVRICPKCGTYNHVSYTHCMSCNFEFPVKPKIKDQASDKELIKTRASNAPVVEDMPVTNMSFTKHVSYRTGSINFRIDYQSGLSTYSDFLQFDGAKQFSRVKARNWWLSHTRNMDYPKDCDEALERVIEIARPVALKVHTNKKPYPEIKGYVF